MVTLIKEVLGVEFDAGRHWVRIPGPEPFTATVATRDVDTTVPIRIERRKSGKDYWLCARKVYVSDDPELESADVFALINEVANRRRLQLEKAHALQAMVQQLDSGARRPRIPTNVKVAVWRRDSGRCAQCESQENLEYDHIIPLAMGGSNTERNLQLLCELCNRRKGATLG